MKQVIRKIPDLQCAHGIFGSNAEQRQENATSLLLHQREILSVVLSCLYSLHQLAELGEERTLKEIRYRGYKDEFGCRAPK